MNKGGETIQTIHNQWKRSMNNLKLHSIWEIVNEVIARKKIPSWFLVIDVNCHIHPCSENTPLSLNALAHLPLDKMTALS